MTRVVSLIPSATEIVCALGFEGALVGRSHECDHPPGVERLPALTEPKLPLDGSSVEIDARVKALVRDGLSVYRVDAERLADLRPEAVVTQSQCEVCAASLRDVEEALGSLVGSRPRIVSLEPATLGDVWEDVRRVAAALGVPERGEQLARELEGRIAVIAERAADRTDRPRVATIEWIEPLMAGGNWMPELVSLAGGENLFGEAGRHSPWLDPESLASADPDVIVVAPCGFSLEKTLEEGRRLREIPGWVNLRAVGEGRVFAVDGHHHFNRPGPRLVESLEILVEILDSGAPEHGFRGSRWKRLE